MGMACCPLQVAIAAKNTDIDGLVVWADLPTRATTRAAVGIPGAPAVTLANTPGQSGLVDGSITVT